MNALSRSEMILGKPKGKSTERPVFIVGRGGRAIFFVSQPDGVGCGWRFRLQGHDRLQGDRSKGYNASFKRSSDAMIAGSAAWLRLGIYR